MNDELLKDCQIDTYRQGPRITVRVYHKPTGIFVEVQGGPSQFKTRKQAIELLEEKLNASQVAQGNLLIEHAQDEPTESDPRH